MSIVRPLMIAMLVLTEVGLWQWRMVIAARGSRSSAMLLGPLGAVLQITAISQVVTNVDDPLSVGAYAVGVGAGVLFVRINRRHEARLHRDVARLAPEAVWSTDLRADPPQLTALDQ